MNITGKSSKYLTCTTYRYVLPVYLHIIRHVAEYGYQACHPSLNLELIKMLE